MVSNDIIYIYVCIYIQKCDFYVLSCAKFFFIAFQRTEESVGVGVVLVLKAIGQKEEMSYLHQDNI